MTATRVFITGSADGLGRAAAQELLEQGHEVVVHARNRDRLTALRDLQDRGAVAVVGDAGSTVDSVAPLADEDAAEAHSLVSKSLNHSLLPPLSV